MSLMLDSIILTSAQEERLPGVLGAVNCLNQELSDMEDAGIEASDTKTPVSDLDLHREAGILIHQSLISQSGHTSS